MKSCTNVAEHKSVPTNDGEEWSGHKKRIQNTHDGSDGYLGICFSCKADDDVEDGWDAWDDDGNRAIHFEDELKSSCWEKQHGEWGTYGRLPEIFCMLFINNDHKGLIGPIVVNIICESKCLCFISKLCGIYLNIVQGVFDLIVIKIFFWWFLLLIEKILSKWPQEKYSLN